MEDKEYITNVINQLYGGKLFDLHFNEYNIKIRLFEEQNKAAVSIRKKDILVYRCKDERMIVLGEVASYFNNKEIESKLMEILL